MLTVYYYYQMSRYLVPRDICLIIMKFVGTDIITKRAFRLFNDQKSNSDNLNRLNISYDIFQSFPQRIVHNIISVNPYVTTQWFLHDRLYDFLPCNTYPTRSYGSLWENSSRDIIIRTLINIKQCKDCQLCKCVNIHHKVDWNGLHRNPSIPIQYINSNFPGCIMWDKLPKCYELDIMMRNGSKINAVEWIQIRNNSNMFPRFVHIKDRVVSPEEAILTDYNTAYILCIFGHDHNNIKSKGN